MGALHEGDGLNPFESDAFPRDVMQGGMRNH